MRRLGTWLPALLLFTRLAAVNPADNTVLDPHQPAPATGSPAEHTGIGATGLIGAALAAAGGGWLIWSRRRSRVPGSGRSERLLSIAETRSLGNRQYLVVAAYGNRRFLLGVCPSRIDLLAPLDDSSRPSP
jgi:flagellar protein FliO/FliZ